MATAALHPVFPVLLGAALALLGGLVSQSFFLFLARRHDHNVLLRAFQSELKYLRSELDGAVDGFRSSLRKGEWPSPAVFIVATPVYDANVGKLGQLRDLDLIDHIVETYAGIKSASEEVRAARSRERMELSDFNDVYRAAAFAQVFVMKLHNRLLGHSTPVNLTPSEEETRSFIEGLPKSIDASVVEKLQTYTWRTVA